MMIRHTHVLIPPYSLISLRWDFSSPKISIAHLNKCNRNASLCDQSNGDQFIQASYRCDGGHHYPISNPWTTWLSLVPKFKSILSCKISFETKNSRPPIWKKTFIIESNSTPLTKVSTLNHLIYDTMHSAQVLTWALEGLIGWHIWWLSMNHFKKETHPKKSNQS